MHSLRENPTWTETDEETIVRRFCPAPHLHRLEAAEQEVQKVRYSRGERTACRRGMQMLAAGPGVNFLLALLWTLRMAQRLTIRGGAFWAANLLTGCFNLLPIPPLDGAQLLECLRMLWRTSDRGWISRKPAGK